MVNEMAETNTYVNMMLDSLKKKDSILDKIIELNNVQTELAKQPELDMDAFSATVEQKQELIDKMQEMDDGFQSLYDRVKEELQVNRARYAEEIRQMQAYIKQLSEKSVQIQTQEEKNRLTLQGHFARMKQEIRTAKKSVQVAADYYKNMSKLNVVDSQFMDKKK